MKLAIALNKVGMEDPKRDEVNSQGDSSDQPGSSRGPPIIDETIVKDSLA